VPDTISGFHRRKHPAHRHAADLAGTLSGGCGKYRENTGAARAACDKAAHACTHIFGPQQDVFNVLFLLLFKHGVQKQGGWRCIFNRGIRQAPERRRSFQQAWANDVL
jgi:hypothetical protein